MRFKRKTDIEKGKLDIAPLVDVVFLLLIFFMLSSSFIIQPSIKINLPDTAVSDSQKEEEFSVIIKRDGTVYFNEYEVTLESLKDRIRFIISKNPERVLIVKADKDVRHGRVIEVIGLAKESGVTHFAIATKPGIILKEDG